MEDYLRFAADISRGSLLLGACYVPKKHRNRILHSIYNITEALGDKKEFAVTWNTWRIAAEKKGFSLPDFATLSKMNPIDEINNT